VHVQSPIHRSHSIAGHSPGHSHTDWRRLLLPSPLGEADVSTPDGRLGVLAPRDPIDIALRRARHSQRTLALSVLFDTITRLAVVPSSHRTSALVRYTRILFFPSIGTSDPIRGGYLPDYLVAI